MIIFIIPAYNEEKNIRDLLKRTETKMFERGFDYKIIVVNDGSIDKTASIVNSLKDKIPLELYNQYPNRGVGEAFRQGFRIAINSASDNDIIITKEADNTSNLEIITEMIDKIRNGYDMVLASCYSKGGGIRETTFYRRITSWGANMLLRLFFPIGVRTYSSFYRAYNSKSLKMAFHQYGNKLIEENGFECMVELLIKLKKLGGFKVSEVPMVLDGNMRKGKSKMMVFKTTLGFIRVIYKQSIKNWVYKKINGK